MSRFSRGKEVEDFLTTPSDHYIRIDPSAIKAGFAPELLGHLSPIANMLGEKNIRFVKRSEDLNNDSPEGKIFEFEYLGGGKDWIAAKNLISAIYCLTSVTGMSDTDIEDSRIRILTKGELEEYQVTDEWEEPIHSFETALEFVEDFPDIIATSPNKPTTWP